LREQSSEETKEMRRVEKGRDQRSEQSSKEK
jgi:hypothetical protein